MATAQDVMVHLSQTGIHAIAEAVRQGMAGINIHTSGNQTLNLSPTDIQAIKNVMGNAAIHTDNGNLVALHLVDDTQHGWSKKDTWDAWLRSLQTAGTFVVGIIAGWIAWQQKKISHTKLNLDLYEKRMDIISKYEDALRCVTATYRWPIPLDDEFNNLRGNNITKARNMYSEIKLSEGKEKSLFCKETLKFLEKNQEILDNILDAHSKKFAYYGLNEEKFNKAEREFKEFHSIISREWNALWEVLNDNEFKNLNK